MHKLGFKLYTTENRHAYLKKYDFPSTKVGFPSDGDSENNALNLIKDGTIDLVVNLPSNQSKQTENNYRIRRTAVDFLTAADEQRLGESTKPRFLALSSPACSIGVWTKSTTYDNKLEARESESDPHVKLNKKFIQRVRYYRCTCCCN
ncbi:unnamed protein product [Phytophthora lilii]|uniref:Unnamed protein product n=1 Tax=Phytophthora lilii TaxID=2077276 RepID=A0A9W6UBR8_9STRA|nr:unnamed protein product [Phytophthora lilii]